MAKKYPWIKLRTDFFDSDLMDWIHEQENGAELIYIYMRLCLLAVNKEDGRIMRELGAIEMPYDIAKLATIIKTTPKAMAKALKVFQQVGIVRTEEDGAITVPGADDMVGTESDSASRMRKSRKAKAQQINEQENVTCDENVTDDKVSHVTNDVTDDMTSCVSHVTDNVTKNVTESDASHVTDNVTKNVTESDASHVTEDVTQNVTLEKEIREREESKKEKKEEKKEEKKNNFDVFSAIDSLSCSQALKDALKDWARMRRQIKAPLNERALAIGLTELKKLCTDEETMVKVVNQTVFNCWKGFFTLRHNAGNQAAPNGSNRREQMKQAVDQGGWG